MEALNQTTPKIVLLGMIALVVPPTQRLDTRCASPAVKPPIEFENWPKEKGYLLKPRPEQYSTFLMAMPRVWLPILFVFLVFAFLQHTKSI